MASRRTRRRSGQPKARADARVINSAPPEAPAPALGERQPARYRRAILLSVVVVVLALALPPLLGAAASFLGERVASLGGLLFCRDNTLLIVEPGNGTERVLVVMSGDGVVGNVAVSPDSHSVAFTYAQGAFGDPQWGADLFVIDLRLSEAGRPTPRVVLRHAGKGDHVEGVAWGPDGRSMLVTYRDALANEGQYADSRTRLELLELESGRRSVVVEDAAEPSWSRDGERIAYVRTEPEQGQQSLWTAHPDGSGATPITQDGEFSILQSPRFSPDGTRLVFAGAGSNLSGSSAHVPDEGSWRRALIPRVALAHGGIPWNLWVFRDRGEPERITQIGEDLMYATWSPDGEKIALVTDMAVYLMEPTGDGQQRLNLRASPRGIAWGSVAEGDE